MEFGIYYLTKLCDMHRFTRAQCRGRHSQDFVVMTLDSLLEQTRYKGSGMHYITRFKKAYICHARRYEWRVTLNSLRHMRTHV